MIGVDYPASKQDLIARAKQEGADENVIQTLQDMPMERFNSPNDVAEAIGKIERLKIDVTSRCNIQVLHLKMSTGLY